MRTHVEPVRVEFVDTDAGGRIHHTAALRWAERAEHQLLRAAGWSQLTTFPRRHVVVDFLAPLRFGDEVRVEIAATHVGRTSITYGWRVVRDVRDAGGPDGAGTELVCVEGSTTCVHVDGEDRPVEVPAPLRAGLGEEVSDPPSTGPR